MAIAPVSWETDDETEIFHFDLSGGTLIHQRPFRLKQIGLGERTAKVIDLVQATYPTATPFEIYSRISAIQIMRLKALTQAAYKVNQGAAPAYNYWFQWQAPILDGCPRASHCSGLPFVVYHTETCAPMTGGGPEALDLAGRVADAWTSFARTEIQTITRLPNWPTCDLKTAPTMIF
jgi:para-nitrobenzyl esterase